MIGEKNKNFVRVTGRVMKVGHTVIRGFSNVLDFIKIDDDVFSNVSLPKEAADLISNSQERNITIWLVPKSKGWVFAALHTPEKQYVAECTNSILGFVSSFTLFTVTAVSSWILFPELVMSLFFLPFSVAFLFLIGSSTIRIYNERKLCSVIKKATKFFQDRNSREAVFP